MGDKGMNGHRLLKVQFWDNVSGKEEQSFSIFAL